MVPPAWATMVANATAASRSKRTDRNLLRATAHSPSSQPSSAALRRIPPVSSSVAPASPSPGSDPAGATEIFGAIERTVGAIVVSDPLTIRLVVGCVAAGGHLLVEDHPGLGKTTLAKSLAGALGLDFRRLQCTADLLPADVTGAPVLGPDSVEPTFRPGPVFTNVLMADELN